MNYNKFNSGAQFQSSIFEKAGNVLSHSPNSPIIKSISIQGEAAIITIEPFPTAAEEETRLKKELEQITGLQIFLKKSMN